LVVVFLYLTKKKEYEKINFIIAYSVYFQLFFW